MASPRSGAQSVLLLHLLKNSYSVSADVQVLRRVCMQERETAQCVCWAFCEPAAAKWVWEEEQEASEPFP